MYLNVNAADSFHTGLDLGRVNDLAKLTLPCIMSRTVGAFRDRIGGPFDLGVSASGNFLFRFLGVSSLGVTVSTAFIKRSEMDLKKGDASGWKLNKPNELQFS